MAADPLSSTHREETAAVSTAIRRRRSLRACRIASYYRRRHEYRSAASALGSAHHRPGGTGVIEGAIIPGSGAGVVE